MCIALVFVFMDDLQIGLAVMSHELEFKFQLCLRIQVPAEVEDERFGASHTPVGCKLDRTEEGKRRTVHVDAVNRQLVSLIFICFQFDD